jgi:hypothetical protein
MYINVHIQIYALISKSMPRFWQFVRKKKLIKISFLFALLLVNAILQN